MNQERYEICVIFNGPYVRIWHIWCKSMKEVEDCQSLYDDTVSCVRLYDHAKQKDSVKTIFPI